MLPKGNSNPVNFFMDETLARIPLIMKSVNFNSLSGRNRQEFETKAKGLIKPKKTINDVYGRSDFVGVEK